MQEMHTLTPEEVRSTTFTTTLRGYDKEEVDAFMLTVAETVSALQDASQNAYRNLGDRMGALLQQAKDSAEEMTSAAQTEALKIREEAESKSREIRQDAEMTAKRTEQEAQRKADDIVATAQSEAAELEQRSQRRIQELEEIEREVRERVHELRVELGALTESLQRIESEPPAEAPAAQDEPPSDTAETPVVVAEGQPAASEELPEDATDKVRLESEEAGTGKRTG